MNDIVTGFSISDVLCLHIHIDMPKLYSGVFPLKMHWRFSFGDQVHMCVAMSMHINARERVLVEHVMQMNILINAQI